MALIWPQHHESPCHVKRMVKSLRCLESSMLGVTKKTERLGKNAYSHIPSDPNRSTLNIPASKEEFTLEVR